jgi:Tfp pilus assembly protein PilN
MKRINLLPPEARVKASRERGFLYAILILAAVVVALFFGYSWQNGIANSKQADLDQVSSMLSTTQQKAQALRPYASIQTERTAMTETAKSIYEARVPWSTVLQEISLVIPENVRLDSLTCTVPTTMQAGGSATTTTPAASGTAAAADVTFTGTTYTHKDVAEFMTRLGLIPQLKDIKLTSSSFGTDSSSGSTSSSTTSTPGATPSPSASIAVVTFTITAALRPYTTAPPTTVLAQSGAQ